MKYRGNLPPTFLGPLGPDKDFNFIPNMMDSVRRFGAEDD